MKKIVLAALLCLVAAGFAFGQDDVAAIESGPKTDNKVFGIQTGFVAGQNLTTEDTVSGRDFALYFTLSETMQIGFRSITDLIAANTSLFNLSYFLTDRISIDLLAGSTSANDTAAGLDVAFAIIKTSSDDAFSTTLKLEAGYLFDENDVAGGAVFGGLVGSLGY